MENDRACGGGLTAGDWIGAVVSGVGVLLLLQFPFVAAPQFGAMFRDFGGALPVVTQLSMTAWLPLLLAFVPGCMLGVAFGPWLKLGARRLLIVASFVVCLGAVAFLGFAMYAPIIGLAGAIR